MSGARADWAALVASRLCHDLVSPLGAIGNGLELLRLVLPPGPELDLMADATERAQARLRLYRLAFGVADADQTVTGDTLRDALAALSERIAVQADLPDSVPRVRARRLMLGALCAESALAWGGALLVGADRLVAEATRLRLDPDLWQGLASGRTPLGPTAASVHFALLADSGAVTLGATETRLDIRL